MRRSAQQLAQMPVRHGDLGDEYRQDEHRHVGGRRPRPGRSGHVEDQGDHSHERSDDRLPRKEPCDAVGTGSINATLSSLSDEAPLHAANRTESVTSMQLAVTQPARLDPSPSHSEPLPDAQDGLNARPIILGHRGRHGFVEEES
jgi:hypothetical protein